VVVAISFGFCLLWLFADVIALLLLIQLVDVCGLLLLVCLLIVCYLLLFVVAISCHALLLFVAHFVSLLHFAFTNIYQPAVTN
jgi:hypothetical protein